MKKQARVYQTDTLAPDGPELPGFRLRRTSRGYTVLSLEYFADPRKDATWAENTRKGMPSEVHWRREYGLDWTSSAGEAYYPEFVAKPHHYIRQAGGLIRQPIVRGWDFGFRHPACIWMQYSPASDRLWLLRELLLTNIDSHSFRDLVLYLSGELDIAQLELRGRTKALLAIEQIKDTPDMPEPPWFESTASRPLRFMDFAGPEALQRRSAVEGESKERTEADILAAGGVNLGVYATGQKARESIFRRLLQMRPDGVPGVLFDPACPILIEGFGGGIIYPKATKEIPDPSDPQKDDYYSNVHEAAGYAAVNLIPAMELAQAPPPVMEWQGRQLVPVHSDGLDIYETREPI